MCHGLGFISIFKSKGCVCLLRSVNYEGIHKLYKHSHVVLGSPSVMSYVHPVHTHFFWHTENPPWQMTLQKRVMELFLVYMCRDYPYAQKKGGGSLPIGFRGMLEGVSAVAIQDTGCSAKELEEIRSRNMGQYKNNTSTSPGTCRSILGYTTYIYCAYIYVHVCLYIYTHIYIHKHIYMHNIYMQYVVYICICIYMCI